MKENVLQGVPPLTSGGSMKMHIPSRESYLFGALESMLKYCNKSVDYDYLMGVSAAAFRLLVYDKAITSCAPDVGCDYYIDLALELFNKLTINKAV